MHPLNGALPGPYMPVRVTSGALVGHRQSLYTKGSKCIVRIIGTCKSGCRVNMSSCRNFSVFSFVIVSNNKKVYTIPKCFIASVV